MTTDTKHEHRVTYVLDRPKKVPTVSAGAIKVLNPDNGKEQTYYYVVHPDTGDYQWVVEGDNSCPHCGFVIEIR